MKKVFQRPLFRSLLAASFTTAAIFSSPQQAQAVEVCYTHCLWYCPADKHSYCQTMGGPQCGFTANCVGAPICGALMIRLECGGFEE